MPLRILSARLCGHRPLAQGDRHHRAWSALRGIGLMISLLILGASCNADQPPGPRPLALTVSDTGATALTPEESRMWMTIGERRFAITLTNSMAARALTAQLPLSLDMADLNGNEKHAELPKALPMQATQPGTIRSGDLMLYGSTTLVVFYVTFDSSYAYTRLGRVDDPGGLREALGKRSVQISFSKK